MTIYTHKHFSSASRIQARSPQTQPGPSPLDSAQPVSFYPAGSEIYAQGERAKNLYQVEFGSVRVYRLLADGRRQISALHLSGDVFGFEADGMLTRAPGRSSPAAPMARAVSWQPERTGSHWMARQEQEWW